MMFTSLKIPTRYAAEDLDLDGRRLMSPTAKYISTFFGAYPSVHDRDTCIEARDPGGCLNIRSPSGIHSCARRSDTADAFPKRRLTGLATESGLRLPRKPPTCDPHPWKAHQPISRLNKPSALAC